jgi:hypothetical protein
MSVEADFFAARNVFQADGRREWTWATAGIQRLFTYSIVPAEGNKAVNFERRNTITDSSTPPRVIVRLLVSVFRAPALVNFFAARIPAI